MSIKKLLLLTGLVLGFTGQGVSFAEDCDENYHRHRNGSHTCMHVRPDRIPFLDALAAGGGRPLTNPGGCGNSAACNGMILLEALTKLGAIDFSTIIPESDLHASLDSLVATPLTSGGFAVAASIMEPAEVAGSSEGASLTVGGIQAATASAAAGQGISEATMGADLGSAGVEIGGAVFNAAALEQMMVPPR